MKGHKAISNFPPLPHSVDQESSILWLLGLHDVFYLTIGDVLPQLNKLFPLQGRERAKKMVIKAYQLNAYQLNASQSANWLTNDQYD